MSRVRGAPHIRRRTSGPAAGMPRDPWRLTRAIVALAAIGIGILGRYRYFNWCIHDDAYISFRYARNLVRGAGLVMNPGERVEGVTNFLWTVLAAPAFVLGLDPATVAQAVGAVLSLGLIAAAFVFSERRLGASWFSIITPALLALNLAFVMESLSGLETLAFAALVFAAYVTFLEERRDERRPAGLWAVWCAVATAMRPEGGLIFALLAGWSAVGVWRGEPVARLRRAAILYAVLVAPLFAFRLAYYGQLLPNTFYTKVGYTAAQLVRGYRYTRYTFVFTMTLPMTVLALVVPCLRFLHPRSVPNVPATPHAWTRLFAGRPRDEAVAVAWVLVFVYIAYVWLVGGDYEPTGRFHAPVLVLFYLLFQESLRSLAIWLGERAPKLRTLALVLAMAGAVFVAQQSGSRILAVLETRGWPQARRAHNEQLRAVGDWLRANTPPTTLIAVSSIGALPYYADRPTLDMMGLTDPRIGRRKVATMGMGPSGHEKGDGAYVLSRRPDIILFDKGQLFPNEVTPEEVLKGARGVSEIEIARAPELMQDYQLMKTRLPAGVFYWLQRRRP